MEPSAPTPSTMSSDLFYDVQSVVPAEEVCEYTFKVELLEKNKISLIVFNTTTGIKYQTHIEEYSDNWEALKINFQHNFSLFYKMFNKALIEKDQSFTVNVLHKIDYVILQVSYVNDLLGFTVDISVNQYKKDNLQESFNIMEYKQKQLEDENKSLKTEIKTIHNELNELKRVINLLGDSLSYDNQLLKQENKYFHHSYKNHHDTICPRKIKGDHKTNYEKMREASNFSFENPGEGSFSIPSLGSRTHGYKNIKHPFLTKDVVNKLAPKVFEEFIQKHNLDYNISKDGYNWELLYSISKNRGVESCYCILNYIKEHYHDLSWKSFKELFDITI